MDDIQAHRDRAPLGRLIAWETGVVWNACVVASLTAKLPSVEIDENRTGSLTERRRASSPWLVLLSLASCASTTDFLVHRHHRSSYFHGGLPFFCPMH